jgi:AcrR family transcriptional regulator
MPAQKKNSTKPRRQLLRHDRIVAEALKLIDSQGLEGFNFRTLAKKLGCGVMSVYHYYPSKAHLMDALVALCISEMKRPPAELPWLERLRIHAHEFFSLAKRHSGFFSFFATYQMNSEAGLEFINTLAVAFEESGLDAETAARHYRSISYYLTGAGLVEATGFINGPSAAEPFPKEKIAGRFPALLRPYPYLGEAYTEQAFSAGLELLLADLAADAGRPKYIAN